MKFHDKYQNSWCDQSGGKLHDYRFLRETNYGVVEKCVNPWCGKEEFYAWNISNDEYLQTHVRAALQPHDPLFRLNYPNFKV